MSLHLFWKEEWHEHCCWEWPAGLCIFQVAGSIQAWSDSLVGWSTVSFHVRVAWNDACTMAACRFPCGITWSSRISHEAGHVPSRYTKHAHFAYQRLHLHETSNKSSNKSCAVPHAEASFKIFKSSFFRFFGAFVWTSRTGPVSGSSVKVLSWRWLEMAGDGGPCGLAALRPCL